MLAELGAIGFVLHGVSTSLRSMISMIKSGNWTSVTNQFPILRDHDLGF